MNPAHVDNFADRCIAHTCALRLLALLAVLAFSTFNAGAQTFSVLHTFTGGGDGIEPSAGVTIDRGGNLYGTSNGGGGDGVAYKLTNRSGNWILNPLLHFDGLDGSFPDARPTIAADGTLYGTTMDGGSQSCEIVGCGVVYHLTPPVSICSSVNCPWSVSLPWMFTFSTGQGDTPNYGDLLFDLAGNIYGVTLNGTNSSGAVYKLTQSGGAWAYSPLHLFESGNDGIFPESGLIMDAVGNLYGTAYFAVRIRLDGKGDLLLSKRNRWRKSPRRTSAGCCRQSIRCRHHRRREWRRHDFRTQSFRQPLDLLHAL